MKTKILLLLILTTKITYAQDTIVKVKHDSVGYINPNRLEIFYWIKEKNQVFAITPMSKRIEKVNGLALGFGHLDNRFIEKQTINGLNIEANPAPAAGAFMAFMALMYLPEVISNIGNGNPTTINDSLVYIKEDNLIIKNIDKTPKLKMNGLNISSGCFFVDTNMNGLNISLGNKFRNFNGLSIAPLGTIADKQTGISLGLINASNDLNGLTVGLYNQSLKLDGLQVGLFNRVGTNHGLQMGLFNKSRSKGFQIGVWNKNAKRSLPILNW